MCVTNLGRPSSAQGHQRLNGTASRSLQSMQTEMLRRTYRGVTSQKDESFTGLDAQQRATMAYGSTSHFLRQAHGFEKPKSSDPPLSGFDCLFVFTLKDNVVVTVAVFSTATYFYCLKILSVYRNVA